jgi:hypothetical protein
MTLYLTVFTTAQNVTHKFESATSTISKKTYSCPTQQRALCSVLFTKYHSSEQVKNTEISRACGTHRGEERCIQDFSGGNLSEGNHLKDRRVEERIILKWMLEKWDGSKDWVDLAQDMDRRRALVYAVMNFRVPQNTGTLLSS